MARRVLSEGAIKVSEGPAPKGQQDLAQGFNPGNRPPMSDAP
jgi:hypothetical protein